MYLWVSWRMRHSPHATSNWQWWILAWRWIKCWKWRCTWRYSRLRGEHWLKTSIEAVLIHRLKATWTCWESVKLKVVHMFYSVYQKMIVSLLWFDFMLTMLRPSNTRSNHNNQYSAVIQSFILHLIGFSSRHKAVKCNLTNKVNDKQQESDIVAVSTSAFCAYSDKN